jgi:hypothetical protein
MIIEYLVCAGVSAGVLFCIWREGVEDDEHLFIGWLAALASIVWPASIVATATVIAIRKVGEIHKALKEAGKQ